MITIIITATFLPLSKHKHTLLSLTALNPLSHHHQEVFWRFMIFITYENYYTTSIIILQKWCCCLARKHKLENITMVLLMYSTLIQSLYSLIDYENGSVCVYYFSGTVSYVTGGKSMHHPEIMIFTVIWYCLF